MLEGKRPFIANYPQLQAGYMPEYHHVQYSTQNESKHLDGCRQLRLYLEGILLDSVMITKQGWQTSAKQACPLT
jgi:hypothetical protein